MTEALDLSLLRSQVNPISPDQNEVKSLNLKRQRDFRVLLRFHENFSKRSENLVFMIWVTEQDLPY